MKNMKKVVAALSATAVMAMGVSAFAEVSATSTNAKFGDYAGGAASVDVADLADQQLTVVIIKAEDANDTLTAEKLYYINQGENGETFWTNMGTKVDLATFVPNDGDVANFIIRIGGENLENVVEVPFTLKNESGEPEVHMWGDVNDDTWVDVDDAMEILYYDASMESVFADYPNGDEWIWTYADVTQDTWVDVDDAMEILYYDASMESVLNDLLD